MRFAGKRTRLAGALALAGAITLVFASVAGAATSPSEYPPPPPSPLAPPDWSGPVPPYLGDVNQLNKTNVEDAQLIMEFRAGLATLTPSQLAVADVFGDEARINVEDAQHIMEYRAGLVTLWQWPDHQSFLDPSANEQNVG